MPNYNKKNTQNFLFISIYTDIYKEKQQSFIKVTYISRMYLESPSKVLKIVAINVEFQQLKYQLLEFKLEFELFQKHLVF